MADDYDRQWTALAQKLLRLLLPDRKLGCLCLRCMVLALLESVDE